MMVVALVMTVALKMAVALVMALVVALALVQVFGIHLMLCLILSLECKAIQMVDFQMFQIGKFQKRHRK